MADKTTVEKSHIYLMVLHGVTKFCLVEHNVY